MSERLLKQEFLKKVMNTYLPLRLDNTPIPGYLPTTGYLNWHDTSVKEITRNIITKTETTENSF